MRSDESLSASADERRRASRRFGRGSRLRSVRTLLEIIDESHRHAGHAGARDGRGHFGVRIVSESLQRYQAVGTPSDGICCARHIDADRHPRAERRPRCRPPTLDSVCWRLRMTKSLAVCWPYCRWRLGAACSKAQPSTPMHPLGPTPVATVNGNRCSGIRVPSLRRSRRPRKNADDLTAEERKAALNDLVGIVRYG